MGALMGKRKAPKLPNIGKALGQAKRDVSRIPATVKRAGQQIPAAIERGKENLRKIKRHVGR